jgi:L-fucose isomerase-like protein
MKPTASALGVIFGNRDFFPDKLVAEARKDLARLFQEIGVEGVMLGTDDSKLGGVETHADARKCADLFRRNRDRDFRCAGRPAQFRR